jgi:hypothetical protein
MWTFLIKRENDVVLVRQTDHRSSIGDGETRTRRQFQAAVKMEAVGAAVLLLVWEERRTALSSHHLESVSVEERQPIMSTHEGVAKGKGKDLPHTIVTVRLCRVVGHRCPSLALLRARSQ